MDDRSVGRSKTKSSNELFKYNTGTSTFHLKFFVQQNFHFYHLIKGDVNSSKLRSIITVYLIIPQPLMAKKTAVAA